MLYGKSEKGDRESLLTFIGPDLVAARWKQWRFYFKDMHLTGTGQQMLGGMYVNAGAMYFPKVYNIEMDPHEDLNLGGITVFMADPAYKAVQEYEKSLKKYPNPPAPNLNELYRIGRLTGVNKAAPDWCGLLPGRLHPERVTR